MKLIDIVTWYNMSDDEYRKNYDNVMLVIGFCPRYIGHEVRKDGYKSFYFCRTEGSNWMTFPECVSSFKQILDCYINHHSKWAFYIFDNTHKISDKEYKKGLEQLRKGVKERRDHYLMGLYNISGDKYRKNYDKVVLVIGMFPPYIGCDIRASDGCKSFYFTWGYGSNWMTFERYVPSWKYVLNAYIRFLVQAGNIRIIENEGSVQHLKDFVKERQKDLVEMSDRQIVVLH